MADALDQNGSNECFHFHDGTRPVCTVENQLGHEYQPCLRQSQTAQALLGSESPRTRRMLLHRENRNFRMVCRFRDMEHRLVTNETAALREAVAAKEAELGRNDARASVPTRRMTRIKSFISMERVTNRPCMQDFLSSRNF